MLNQYVNKVVQSNGITLIDISDTTAVASDVAEGKFFYLATGEKVEGTASGDPSTVPDIEPLTVTENGEYTASGDGFNPVTVNVANVKKIKTGTYIPSETYASTGNREIVSLNDIGFTPTKFVLAASNIKDLNNTQYAMILTYYDALPELNYVLRMHVTFSSTSGGTTSPASFSGWTSQAVGLLYLSNGIVTYRTSANNRLLKDVKYTWVATE